MVKKILSLLLIFGMLASPSNAHAGGWGVATLDAWPQNVVVGKPITVTLVVRQHGIHVITEIVPEFEFRNIATRESFRVRAKLQVRLARFITIITFPSAGEWTWEIVNFPKTANAQLDSVENTS